MTQFPHANQNILKRRSGFTLIEIIVAVAVLAILIGVAFKGVTALTESAKVQETEGLLKALSQAIDAYKLEVKQSRAGGGSVGALYNGAPPDNFDVFTPTGANLAGFNVKLVKGNPNALDLADPRDSSTGVLAGFNQRRYGDVRAMVLAMRLWSPKASEILDGINEKYRVNEGNLVYDPNDGTDSIPLIHYVDAWGTPIEYYSVCTAINSPDPRERTAFSLVHNSNAEPVLVSYGPDGPEQFSSDIFGDSGFGDTSLVSDFNGGCAGCTVGKIDNALNQDNVYSSETIKDRMNPK
ncbi:MAG: prepilin-type N-terminal cleavage/methylation domain-containing protein [Phycisphaerales bacterium]|nr:prepilin-type N-terminal cleavage/methylation domain-containing protein [Phycisphaerales bacterium]